MKLNTLFALSALVSLAVSCGTNQKDSDVNSDHDRVSCNGKLEYYKNNYVGGQRPDKDFSFDGKSDNYSSAKNKLIFECKAKAKLHSLESSRCDILSSVIDALKVGNNISGDKKVYITWDCKVPNAKH